ncbi:hypothetical protein MU582_10585 [Nocardioidaceae bacterium SCSIO 66511]|nr:hypothetical protein MU582_10585 [Nocardioidaceae bacterium SCSIO 66511]
MSTYLVRELTDIKVDDRSASCTLRAVAAATVAGLPGYLTGEPPQVQGIETTLPNLPSLLTPSADDEVSLAIRVTVVAPDIVRLVVGPPDDDPVGGDGTGTGIVIDPVPGPTDASVRDLPDAVEIATELFRVRVTKNPFTVLIEDRQTGRIVLRSADRLRQAAGLPLAPSMVATEDALTVNFELEADEEVLGFGEQFSRLAKNGQRLTLRSADALGTGTGAAYKPVPVWHSTAGYAGFLNTGAVITADVGHSMPSVFGLTTQDTAMDLYVVVGADPKRRLTSYTELTGRAEVPPLWAFGYWMGRCRYHSREEMLDVAAGMRNHEVPCDVLHLDPDWLVVDRLNCDFIWNTDRFGDRGDFIEELAAQALRLSLWELPYLDPESPRYREAEDRGFLVRTTDGAIARVAGTPTPDGRHRALVDFTNPDAVRWWQELHRDFLDDGVAVFKTDFGEGLPADAALADGTPPANAHNLYPLRYNAAVSDGIARMTGRAPLVWGRSGWAGSHRYPGQWGGDAESTVAGMQATVRAGLSYAMSAPGLWSHDIGGFFGPELTPGLYVRWTQLGALSPMMRAHGLRPREPWAFDDETLRIARTWIRLRYELLPYLWQVVHESLRNGWPVMRPLALEFADDPIAARIDSQFLLGSDLLVTPVFDDGTEPVDRRFYVPSGEWTDLLSDERFTGPGYVTRTVRIEEMPVLVRTGAVIPRIRVDESVRNTDDLAERPWTLQAYGSFDEGHEVTLVGFDRVPFTARLTGDTVLHS